MTATKNKKVDKKNNYLTLKLKKRTGFLVVAGVIILLIGFVLYQAFYIPPLKLATTQEIDQQKIAVKAMGFYYRATSCNPETDTMSHEQRVQAFDRYFRVNKYANRAVIRGCNDTDMLIAKTKHGIWEEVFNLNLDSRQSPKWQRACLIEDITTADDKVRPENNSIDQYNLKACNYLRKHEAIMKPWEY